MKNEAEKRTFRRIFSFSNELEVLMKNIEDVAASEGVSVSQKVSDTLERVFFNNYPISARRRYLYPLYGMDRTAKATVEDEIEDIQRAFLIITSDINAIMFNRKLDNSQREAVRSMVFYWSRILQKRPYCMGIKEGSDTTHIKAQALLVARELEKFGKRKDGNTIDNDKDIELLKCAIGIAGDINPYNCITLCVRQLNKLYEFPYFYSFLHDLIEMAEISIDIPVERAESTRIIGKLVSAFKELQG